MSNWLADLTKGDEREKKQRAALDKPFGTILTSVSSASEIGKFSFYGNSDREIPVIHPFSSSSSWIRAMPEAGAAYVATFRADEPMPQLLGTFQRQTRFRISDYNSGTGVYRPLYPGELEMNSSGLAQLFMPRRARYEQRAGVVYRWADQDSLIAGTRSPVHVRQFMNHQSGTLGDESRIGIVSRPKERSPGTGGGKSTWQLSYPKVREKFAGEHFIHMVNPAGETPAVLFQSQKGHVIDSEGEHLRQSVTQIPLRYQEKMYANDDTFTLFEIDEKGNYYMRTADAAAEGYELNIPAGYYKKTVFKDEIITIIANREDAVGKNSNHTVGENYKMTVTKNVQISSVNGGSNFVFESTPGQEKVFLTTKSGHALVYDDTTGKEAIYLTHKSGSQIVMDQDSAIKLISKSGNMIFLDDKAGALTLSSKSGAFVTFKDVVTMGDKSGKQLISMDGSSKIQISADADVTLNAKSVSLAGGSINIGNNAVFSAVIGEMLSVLFDSHIHAGALGPTSPPLPPMTASLMNLNPATSIISKFVKIRGNLI